MHISFPQCPNKMHTHYHKEEKRQMRETESRQYLLLPEMVLFVNQEVLFSHKAWRGFLATILLHLGTKPPRTSVSPSLATSSIQPSCLGFQEEQGPDSPGQAAELDSINPTRHASTDPPLPAALLWATAGFLFQPNLILRLSVLCWPVNPNCVSYKPVRTAGLTPRD